MLNQPKYQNPSPFEFFLTTGKILGLVFVFLNFSFLQAQIYIESNVKFTINDGTIFHSDSFIYLPQKKDSLENKTKIYIVEGTVTINFPSNNQDLELVYIDATSTQSSQILENLTVKSTNEKKIDEEETNYIEPVINETIPDDKNKLLAGKIKTVPTTNTSSSHKKYLDFDPNEIIHNILLFQIEENNFWFREISLFRYLNAFKIRPPPIV